MNNNQSIKLFWLFLLVAVTASCATSPMIAPQINSLVVGEKYAYALKTLEANKEAYGANNQLLYWLDYGLLLHLGGKYDESIKAFNKAMNLYDQNFTTSVSNQGTTWLINDNTAPYRGEDFERVLINIFQSLNYLQIGKTEDALVEARNIDSLLKSINNQYSIEDKNVYSEDAFARFLMGIMYELTGGSGGLNDAYIAYRNSLKLYEEDFKPNYGVTTPPLLIENLLSVAEVIDEEEFKKLERKYYGKSFPTLREKEQKAEVYLIYYFGLSPIKHQAGIVLPLPGGYIHKLAFPEYGKREYELKVQSFSAVSDEKITFQALTQKVDDISSIAVQNLENRRGRVLAKALTRSTGKYFLERTQEQMLRRRYNDQAADAFKYVSSIFNIASEQPDLRSWQTLPGEIRMSRLLLVPGRYEFFANKKLIGDILLKKGDKKFLIYRSN